MFCVVQLDSEVLKDKTVVPSMWLNKNNTLCILPPAITTHEIERLAQTNTLPMDGWQMHNVTAIQEFDTFTHAKESLEKIKKIESEIAEAQRPRRKRSRPRFHDSDDDEDYYYDEEDEDLSSLMQDDSQSPFQDANGITEPMIVKVEPMAHSRQLYRRRKRRSTQNETSFAVLPSDTGDTTCACNSSCHNLILQSMARMQKQLEDNTQLLYHLVASSQAQAQDTTFSLPTLPLDFPTSLPVKQLKDFDIIEEHLKDPQHFANALPYFTALGGKDAKQTLKKIMSALVTCDIGRHINWRGRGAKIPFSSYKRIHKLIYSAVRQNPKVDTITLSDIENGIKDFLRGAPEKYLKIHKIEEMKKNEQKKVLDC